jgi:hypothetical protein
MAARARCEESAVNLVLAVAPLILLAVAFSVYCLNILRHEGSANLPPWLWVAFILLSQPAGGIAYLAVGRPRR